jgi:hypothetical protein
LRHFADEGGWPLRIVARPQYKKLANEFFALLFEQLQNPRPRREGQTTCASDRVDGDVMIVNLAEPLLKLHCTL